MNSVLGNVWKVTVAAKFSQCHSCGSTERSVKIKDNLHRWTCIIIVYCVFWEHSSTEILRKEGGGSHTQRCNTKGSLSTAAVNVPKANKNIVEVVAENICAILMILKKKCIFFLSST